MLVTKTSIIILNLKVEFSFYFQYFMKRTKLGGIIGLVVRYLKYRRRERATRQMKNEALERKIGFYISILTHRKGFLPLYVA